MIRPLYGMGICLLAFLVVCCATKQSRYVMLGEEYPPRAGGAEIEIFREGVPDRAFERISRLDVHLEKTFFVGSGLDNALSELKKQARLSGADAIIEIDERSSTLAETKIYHVTATGIRYTD